MFTVIGVSTLKGEVKVRFANEMTRVKVLAKNGHTDIELMELPQPMDKPAAVTFLKTTGLYTNSKFQAAIDAADAKYNGSKTVKVTVAKAPAKAPAKTTVKATKTQTETA